MLQWQKSLSLWMFGRNQLPPVSANLFNRSVWLIESHLWYGSFLQKKIKFSFQSHGHPLQIRLKPLQLLKHHTKLFFWKHMTCWACKCHTITSRKQEGKISGLFSPCYCRQDTTTCKRKRDTKILEVTKIHPFLEHGNRLKDSHCLQLKLIHLSLYCTSSMVLICNTNLLFHTSLLFLTVAKINS